MNKQEIENTILNLKSIYNVLEDCGRNLREDKKCLDMAISALTQQLNNGWIPFDSRLPSHEEYCKNDGRFIVTDGNRRYQSVFNIYEKRFEKELYYSRFIVEDKCVIAWQPLPPEYRKDGAVNG
jgi:hypothetical protein